MYEKSKIYNLIKNVKISRVVRFWILNIKKKDLVGFIKN